MLTRPIAYQGQAEGSIGTRWSLPAKKAPQRGSGTARGSLAATGAPAPASHSPISNTARLISRMGRHLRASTAPTPARGGPLDPRAEPAQARLKPQASRIAGPRRKGVKRAVGP